MTEASITVPPAGSTPRGYLIRQLVRRPVALAAMLFLAVVAIAAILGPVLAPHDPNAGSLQTILLAPDSAHFLGTDGAGRDVLSRLLYATRVSVAAALVATVTSLLLGVVAGLLAGYYHGWYDNVFSWSASLIMSLPGIVVLLAARAVLGPSIWLAMIVFGVILSPAYFRLVYAAVNAVRGELYIDAARVSGLSDARIISRHVLTVVRAPIIIQSAIIVSIAIAVQSGLEFLGLGDLSVPTWGQMLNDAFISMNDAPILMLWPSLVIALTCIALTLLANGMRDVLERTSSVRRRRRARGLTNPGATRTTSTINASVPTRTATATTEETAEKAVETIRHDDDGQSSQQSSQELLRVSGLRIAYEQSSRPSVEVVHGVSLDVRRGEVHGLIGESGSGKTQTAFAILGVLPRGGSVTAGTISFDGVELVGPSTAASAFTQVRGTRIAYIPQEPMSNLDQSFRVGYQLTQPLRKVLGLSREDAKQRALNLLERVGIPDPQRTFNAYPFEISGGMAQRVLIAGAVSTDPDLIIADEPTTALDVTVQAEVLDLLRGLQQERGMAILLVTHNFGVVADLCDRVTVMQRGHFVEQGPVRTILRTPDHPYTQSLLGAILDGGPARPAFVDNEERR